MGSPVFDASMGFREFRVVDSFVVSGWMAMCVTGGGLVVRLALGVVECEDICREINETNVL